MKIFVISNQLLTLCVVILCVILYGCAPLSNNDDFFRSANLQSENQQLQSENDQMKNQLAQYQDRLAQYYDLLAQCQNQSQQNNTTQYTTQEKNNCLTTYDIVLKECGLLYQGEPNSVALQNKIAFCVKSKGFENGIDTCK